jgi:protein tyrosine phosphatase (PTP) superfamily phosphohydrolase (DUF442 family)
MNGWRSRFYCALLPAALTLAGCHHCGSESCYPSAPAVRTAGILPAHPLTPCQACPAPSAPPAPPFNPPGPVGPPPGPVQQAWGQPSPPSVSLGVPVPAASEPPRESARLSTPQSPEPPRAIIPNKPVVPEGGEKPPRSPELPAGIANFAEVFPGVATGLRPMLDGLDWLKANGFKTVLQVRAPGENGESDRQLLEKRGLKYLSLEVSPTTLTPAVVDEFNKIVADTGNRPLFVYDRDGTLAGALWYLHFRTAAKLPDEEARRKAAALGLREDADGAPRELWLAVQKYLADQGKK